MRELYTLEEVSLLDELRDAFSLENWGQLKELFLSLTEAFLAYIEWLKTDPKTAIPFTIGFFFLFFILDWIPRAFKEKKRKEKEKIINEQKRLNDQKIAEEKKIERAQAKLQKQELEKQRIYAKKQRQKDEINRQRAEKQKQLLINNAETRFGYDQSHKVIKSFKRNTICLGMPKKMVDFLKGKKFNLKRTVTKKGTTERYNYQSYISSRGNTKYKLEVDFQDGLVIKFQDL